MKNILIVDDEKNYLLVLSALLAEEGYAITKTDDPAEALRLAEETDPNLVITDLKMPSMSGIELLKGVKAKRPDTPVIIMTAFGTIETAVEAMREGAFNYILKPFSNEELKIIVKRALELGELTDEKKSIRQELSSRLGFDRFIFRSEPMRGIDGLIAQVAPTRTTVLIEGESGVGKEVVARQIHRRSPRSRRPFVAVNCGAIAETLLESELFGHEKGAFTGASGRKKGRFEAADGATLFLDEVSSMSAALQVKLLRVLQEQTFERVGGVETVSVDVRVIAASNRDLKELVGTGEFREDLFYRLNVFTIKVPSLRDRRADIMPLAEHFLSLFSSEMGRGVSGFSGKAEEKLKSYSWPGNARELKNVIERAVVVCAGREIKADDILLAHGGASSGSRAAAQTRPDEGVKETITEPDASGGGGGGGKPLPEAIDEYEKRLIQKALEMSGGVQAKAARILGISPASLQYKLAKYKL